MESPEPIGEEARWALDWMQRLRNNNITCQGSKPDRHARSLAGVLTELTQLSTHSLQDQWLLI
jgi:hypothetical protein